MENIRKPTNSELRLILKLLDKSKTHISKDKVEKMFVSSLNDGGMGSLRIWIEGISNSQQVFGSCIADLQFQDTDEVIVLASLYVDKNGEIFELDIWKVDFSPLICLPDDFSAYV